MRIFFKSEKINFSAIFQDNYIKFWTNGCQIQLKTIVNGFFDCFKFEDPSVFKDVYHFK